MLFFLFLCVCSADISSSPPPFFSPSSWIDNVFHGTLSNVVYYEHLDGTSFGGPSLGFLANPSISCVVAVSTWKWTSSFSQLASTKIQAFIKSVGRIYSPKSVQYLVLWLLVFCSGMLCRILGCYLVMWYFCNQLLKMDRWKKWKTWVGKKKRGGGEKIVWNT